MRAENYGNEDAGQRFRVLCAGNIIHADVGYVMRTRRKHGDKERGYEEMQFVVALPSVLKRKSNSSGKNDVRRAMMSHGISFKCGLCFPAIILLLRFVARIYSDALVRGADFRNLTQLIAFQRRDDTRTFFSVT